MRLNTLSVYWIWFEGVNINVYEFVYKTAQHVQIYDLSKFKEKWDTRGSREIAWTIVWHFGKMDTVSQTLLRRKAEMIAV